MHLPRMKHSPRSSRRLALARERASVQRFSRSRVRRPARRQPVASLYHPAPCTRLHGTHRSARVRACETGSLQGIDEVVESLLDFRCMESLVGAYRIGVRRGLNGLTPELLDEADEGLEGRFETSQRRAEGPSRPWRVSGGLQRSSTGE
jgi:hypothetical protein